MKIMAVHTGGGEWVGVIELNGSEIFRSTENYQFPHEAFEVAAFWLSQKG